jgi:hypothetical protein
MRSFAAPREASGCPLFGFARVVADDPLLAAELVVDQLAAVDLPSRVGEEILRLDGLRARLDAQISSRVSEFDLRLEHTIRSDRTAAAWRQRLHDVAAGLAP